jgi:hypothetical protein
MSTREENAMAAAREAEELDERQQSRLKDLQWAEQWQRGDCMCPRCRNSKFRLIEVVREGSTRYEVYQCKNSTCKSRWEVEFRETALVICPESDGPEYEWLEIKRWPISGTERATLLAALRYWQREGLNSAGHERDIATDGGCLEPLSPRQIDALCLSINRN